MEKIIVFAIAGAIGSLAKDCVEDNRIQMPYLKDGYFFLGFIGGMFVGAFVGYVVDNSILSALMGGYVGTSAIKNLVNKEIKVIKK